MAESIFLAEHSMAFNNYRKYKGKVCSLVSVCIQKMQGELVLDGEEKERKVLRVGN